MNECKPLSPGGSRSAAAAPPGARWRSGTPATGRAGISATVLEEVEEVEGVARALTPVWAVALASATAAAAPPPCGASPYRGQVLTLVHFSARLECAVWDWGCA